MRNSISFLLLVASCMRSSSFLSRTNTKNRIMLRMTSTATPSEEKKFNPREERRRILGTDNFNRMGFEEEKQEVKGIMVSEFSSPLIAELRANKGVIKRGELTIKLAEFYGFCWGVERAVSMAYEARSHFPDRKIHITNEIIHNPQVNERLQAMDMNFIKNDNGNKDFNVVGSGDVVILPAFGATIQEMQLLDKMGVQIVDTTCPWVSKVWNAVDSHRRKGQTSIIHGKWSHEETIATASFCDEYIIVKDMDEATYVSKYILEGGNKEEFMKKFKNAVSKNFDPEKHLRKVGLANQTTMYKKETKEIGRLLETTMLKKFGPAVLAEHYAEFDTICDATQERQDALIDMVGPGNELDFVLVVGGFDSSNTAHLKEIPEKYGVKAYHIDRSERIKADNSIEHRTEHGDIVVEKNFLRKGPLTIGVTSGASTPDKFFEDSIEKLVLLHKLL